MVSWLVELDKVELIDLDLYLTVTVVDQIGMRSIQYSMAIFESIPCGFSSEMQIRQDATLECPPKIGELSNTRSRLRVTTKEALRPQNPLSLYPCNLVRSSFCSKSAHPVAPIALADDRVHAFQLCARNPRQRSDARRVAWRAERDVWLARSQT